jgi:hypothetical protein
VGLTFGLAPLLFLLTAQLFKSDYFSTIRNLYDNLIYEVKTMSYIVKVIQKRIKVLFGLFLILLLNFLPATNAYAVSNEFYGGGYRFDHLFICTIPVIEGRALPPVIFSVLYPTGNYGAGGPLGSRGVEPIVVDWTGDIGIEMSGRSPWRGPFKLARAMKNGFYTNVVNSLYFPNTLTSLVTQRLVVAYTGPVKPAPFSGNPSEYIYGSGIQKIMFGINKLPVTTAQARIRSIANAIDPIGQDRIKVRVTAIAQCNLQNVEDSGMTKISNLLQNLTSGAARKLSEPWDIPTLPIPIPIPERIF